MKNFTKNSEEYFIESTNIEIKENEEITDDGDAIGSNPALKLLPKFIKQANKHVFSSKNQKTKPRKQSKSKQ